MSRTYVSPLRQEQFRSTRVRIIEAVAHVLARGLTELSIPSVADEAGVSVATVYRHFKNKQDLLAGLGRHYADRVGAIGVDDVDRRDLVLEELIDSVSEVFTRIEGLDPALRAAIASQPADEFRQANRSGRLAVAERTIHRRLPTLADRDLKHLRDVFVVLTSSATLRAFETLIGSSAAEAGATVEWALRRLLAASEAAG